MSDVQNFDGQFERQLRAYAAAGAPVIHREAVWRAVAAGVDSRRTSRWGLRWPTPTRTMFAGLTTAAVLLVGAAIGFAIWSDDNTQVVVPGAVPTASPTLTAMPTASPVPRQPLSPSPSSGGPVGTSAPDDVVYGWPDNRGNPPGLYSWDVSRQCTQCIFGRIHNHRSATENQDANVEIAISTPGRAAPDVVGRAGTVAGHPGMYYSIDDLHERWRVDIQGTMIEIDLETERRTSQAVLDEAHEIIESMRTEPSSNKLGFRIVFRLVTGDWDSPF